MSTRELRFWPLLFGVYALVWGLEVLVTRLRGMPVVVSFDVTATDLAIFGIVFGVWLVAFALRKQESNETATNVVAI
jgi:hypothetical protein